MTLSMSSTPYFANVHLAHPFLNVHATYLECLGDLDLSRDAERRPLRPSDFLEADRRPRDTERDLERLGSLGDRAGRNKVTVAGWTM